MQSLCVIENALFLSRVYCKTQTPEAKTFTHDLGAGDGYKFVFVW